MGGNMAERLRLGGHQVVGFDFNADAVAKHRAISVSRHSRIFARICMAARRSGSWCRRANLWMTRSRSLRR
jgi:6-phosphogluconate dehydrogenase (decarboxylating)